MELERVIVENKKVYESYNEIYSFNKSLGIKTIEDLNNKVKENGIKNIISKVESFQNEKLNTIAENIIKNNTYKLVLIAGPSSSGKTTFAKKLEKKLNENGKKVFTLSMDNYFKERCETPKLPNGDYDFESLDAMDLELFHSQLKDMLDLKNVNMPEFNFYTGEKEFGKHITKLDEDTIIIMEGIHALNPAISENISETLKYKIYVAPMIALNLNNEDKVKSTDIRIIRRLVRDYRTRGHKVEYSLKMWENITNGEKKYIYPYIKMADIVFNTSFVYELLIMKNIAMPLLLEVDKSCNEYSMAQNLYELLDKLLPVSTICVPNDSILKEFIG